MSGLDLMARSEYLQSKGTDTLQHINRISVLAAGNPYQVMDYWLDLEVEIETQLVTNPALSDYEVFGAYNNEYSGLPPNFFFEQTVYGWDGQNYIVVKCNITNRENTEMPMQPGLDVVQVQLTILGKMTKYSTMQ